MKTCLEFGKVDGIKSDVFKIPYFLLVFSLLLLISCTRYQVIEKRPDFSDVTGGGSWSVAQSNNLETCAAKNYGDPCYVVHKFGVNSAVGTTLVPITAGTVYQMPTIAQSLYVCSSDARDTTIGGAGARELTVIGIGSDWKQVTCTVALNGLASAEISGSQCDSAHSDGKFYRVYRAYVSKSANYSELPPRTGSQMGNLYVTGNKITDCGKTTPTSKNLWALIPGGADAIQSGQSKIGAYTVPLGYTAYIAGVLIGVDSSKSADIYFFQRTNANSMSPEFYSAFRVVNYWSGVMGMVEWIPTAFNGPFVGPTDLIIMGINSAGTSVISANFDLLLIKS